MAMTLDDRVWLTRELDEVKGLLRVQNGRVGVTETRLTIIETEREMEARELIKRGMWAGIVGAFGLTAAWDVIKFLSHK